MSEQRKPWVRVSYGSGNPAGAPDFKPLNPWGRSMPKAPPPPEPLHQVFVMDPLKGAIPVGPKMGKQFCDAIADVIRQNILNGMEHRWSDPVVVRV